MQPTSSEPSDGFRTSRDALGRAKLDLPRRELFFSKVESPVGPLTLVAEGDDLVGVYFANAAVAAAPPSSWVRDDRRLRAAAVQLGEYFAGRRTSFELPLAPRGTPFQRAVWSALQDIPFGETASYGELARAIGKPAASRAVGAANGKNPLSIVIPCHRVIGADGSMTGYGGEISRKRTLLALEARVRSAGAALDFGASIRQGSCQIEFVLPPLV
jgi:methylated-DNA-[protein]-cysteine S-methyltransferase